MSEKLPKLTTMMLDALVGTLPRLPKNTRAAAVCRCVFTVYCATHGTKAPWEVTGETPAQAEKRVKIQPVTIIDTTAEITHEETRVYEENRARRHVAVSSSQMQGQGTVPRANGKRMRSQHNTG